MAVLPPLYRISQRAVSLLTRSLDAIHQGVWLGFLGRDALARISAEQYDRWEMYQAREHNLGGLAPWESLLVDEYFQGRETVLIAAVGGGREAIALARRGFEVEAFDCNPSLLGSARDLAREEGLVIRFVDAGPDQVPSGGECAAAIVGWGGYMHMIGREQRVRFLEQLARRLPTDAPVILSFFTRQQDKRFNVAAMIANLIRKMRFSRERVEVGDAIANTFDHYFVRAEIEEELQAGGFRMVEFHERPYGHAVGLKGDGAHAVRL